MSASQEELYCKCTRKLDTVLSLRDCDLRILVGHSNMLQSLNPSFILEYDDDAAINDDHKSESPNAPHSKCANGADHIACSEHIEYIYSGATRGLSYRK